MALVTVDYVADERLRMFGWLLSQQTKDIGMVPRVLSLCAGTMSIAPVLAHKKVEVGDSRTRTKLIISVLRFIPIIFIYLPA
jgi:hypothetical protein